MAEAEPSFGALLRRYRERAGLTLEALAERAELTASAIVALEHGRRRHPYPHTVRRLAEALELSDVERAAFAARPAPRGGSRQAAAEAPRPAMPPSNLPTPRTSLIGRDGAIAALVDLVPAHTGRLVTLTGIGGCGKTRLALAVATASRERFAGGVWLVDLAPVADPALVPRAIAAVLGVLEAPERSLADTLVLALGERRLLIVLDNCEHLIDACAELADRLLERCPGLHLLATSREPLQIAGEHAWRVQLLTVPDPEAPLALPDLLQSPAVQLFVERAQAVEAGFDLTAENAVAVVQICARLDGIPLALELAAAQVRVLSTPQIVERLDDSLRLLTGNSRAAPRRQQTLRAALDWSYALLPAVEAGLLRRLAPFAGGFELEAAEDVGCGPDLPAEEVLERITALVDKSLLQVEPGSEPARYRLLEPVRQYALLHLKASGDAEATATRHAAFYCTFAERAAPELRGRDQLAWLARLDREHDNLRAALRWLDAAGDVVSGLRLAGALVGFWEGRGYLSEGRQWLGSVLAAATSSAAAAGLRTRALLGAGALAEWQGDLDAAVRLLDESLSLARATDDPAAAAWATAWLGVTHFSIAHLTHALALLEASLEQFRALDDQPGTAFALCVLGTGVALLGDAARARLLLEESLALFSTLGDLRYGAIATTMLGYAVMVLGDVNRAAALVVEGLRGHLAVGDRVYAAYGLVVMAAILNWLKQREAAVRLLGTAEALRKLLSGPLAAVTGAQHDLLATALHRHLSEVEFERAWSAGHALPLEQAIAEAEAGVAAADRAATPDPRESLTPREREVARLLAQGHSDRQIANMLAISPRTVAVHVQHVLAKLGLHSRWQIGHRPAAPARPDGR